MSRITMNNLDTIVFASNNKHKLDEINSILGNHIEVLSLEDVGFTGEVEETAATFAGNALLKARAVYDFCRLPTLADDSGLEVEALQGQPGVLSARFAGQPKDDEKNLQKVLALLQGQTNRKARFVTVLAFIHKGLEYLFEGEVKGQITTEKRGSNGFGYDPIFLPEHRDKTFGQMTAAEKNSLSHRGRAAEEFSKFLMLQRA